MRGACPPTGDQQSSVSLLRLLMPPVLSYLSARTLSMLKVSTHQFTCLLRLSSGLPLTATLKQSSTAALKSCSSFPSCQILVDKWRMFYLPNSFTKKYCMHLSPTRKALFSTLECILCSKNLPWAEFSKKQIFYPQKNCEIMLGITNWQLENRKP